MCFLALRAVLHMFCTALRAVLTTSPKTHQPLISDFELFKPLCFT
eukprot:UN25718